MKTGTRLVTMPRKREGEEERENGREREGGRGGERDVVLN